MRGSAGRQTWVAGLAIERDAYTAHDVPRFDYAFTVPGMFAQDDVDVDAVAVALVERAPRRAQRVRHVLQPARVGARRGRDAGRAASRSGTGFFAPTPLTEETEAAGLTRLQVAGPLEAERGLSASFDCHARTDRSRTRRRCSPRASAIPLHVERSPSYVLSTLPEPTTNAGLELLGTFRREPFSVTATYTYVRARETVDADEDDVPLTPRHSAGIVGMWEAEDVGRVGVEWYFTGAAAPRRESVPAGQRART